MIKKFVPFIELFEIQVLNSLENKAINSPQENLSFTYNEVNSFANKIAYALCELGIKKNDIIGVASDRKINSYLIIIALLKLRATIVFLYLDCLRGLLNFIIKDSKLSYILSSDSLTALFKEVPLDVNILDTSSLLNFNNYELIENITSKTFYEDIIHTSGYSCKPKRALLFQGVVSELLNWERNYYDKLINEKILKFFSLNFDIFYQEFFTTLSTENQLVTLSKKYKNQSNYLLEFIKRKKINKIIAPYIILVRLAEFIKINNIYPKSLRKIISLGEEFIPTTALNNLVKNLKTCKFYNFYAFSENQIISIYQLKTDENQMSIRIGRSAVDSKIFILDDNYNIVPKGQPDTLYVISRLLSLDYLDRPELTAERFIANPFQIDFADNTSWSTYDEPNGLSVHETNELFNIIDINGLVINHQLVFNVAAQSHQNISAKLTNTFKSKLEEIIYHTTSQQRNYLTVSDIDYLITQACLDKLEFSREINNIYLASSLPHFKPRRY